ncbi:MAG: hypothetical protein D3908_02820 [Candidatus Electrothrix sp. AUS4]|nr:hypothetical protein [Candidatus Electrothrix sp. AUS4]
MPAFTSEDREIRMRSTKKSFPGGIFFRRTSEFLSCRCFFPLGKNILISSSVAVQPSASRTTGYFTGWLRNSTGF